LKELLEHSSVSNIIFEKVLFQALDDYEVAEGLLRDRGINSWVNCPLRVYPFYKELKSTFFKPNIPFTYKYKGGEWVGLGCNGIQYIDHLNFFCSKAPNTYDVSNLDLEVIESKRNGFV
jgi:hypothetical protein